MGAGSGESYAESEIWPITILELGARRVPQVLVNGRLSDNSFAGWKKRVPFLATALFENLSHVVRAGSEVMPNAFGVLRARAGTVRGNLKVDSTRTTAVDQQMLDRASGPGGNRPVWAPPSRHHDGEDPIAGRVHQRAQGQAPPDLSRWSFRATAAALRRSASDLARKGLKVVRTVPQSAAIEQRNPMCSWRHDRRDGLYLRLTEIAFVDVSLTWEGGRTRSSRPCWRRPCLPAARQNFRDSYQKLLENRRRQSWCASEECWRGGG